MADLTDIQAAQTIKVVGSDASGIESNTLAIKSNQEARIVDTCDTSAVNIALALSTTPVEGKVGGSRLINRKYVEMQALDNNIKWGYDTTCPFDLFKNQFLVLMLGNQPIYFKMSTGTGTVAFAEKS